MLTRSGVVFSLVSNSWVVTFSSLLVSSGSVNLLTQTEVVQAQADCVSRRCLISTSLI